MKRLTSLLSAMLLAIAVSSIPADAGGYRAPQASHKTVAMVQPLPQPDLPVQADVQPVQPPAPIQNVQTPPPAPAAAPASSNCVSGYTSGDYYLDKIIAYESGGNSCATNYLGCFGLLQACPGDPLRAACGGDPACQIEWFQANKTGGRTWAQVWQHELDYGWW